MMNSMRNQLSIPQEIIFEIFSWLPIKSLMRFKCLSRFFNSLVSESDFMDIHGCRSLIRPGGTKFFLHENQSVFYGVEKKDGKDSASFLQIERFNELYDRDPASSRLDCVNGLFCIWGSLPAAIFNPSTREIRFLPNQNEEFHPMYYSLGFSPEENKYKVLSTANHIREQYNKNWVFTLGVDKSWRETKSTPSILCDCGVYINGVIYKFAIHNRIAIAAFDVTTENIKVITLWNNAYHHSWHYRLIEVKGQLAVIEFEARRRHIHLRVLEQTQEEQVWKIHIIHFPSIWKDIQLNVKLSCTSCDGKILFIVNLDSDTLCFCYDVTRHNWRKLEIKGLPKDSYIRGIYSFVERLVM